MVVTLLILVPRLIGTGSRPRLTGPVGAGPHGDATPVVRPDSALPRGTLHPLPSTTPSPARTPASTTAAYPWQMLALVNDARRHAGCAAVRMDSRLVAAATVHSRDMAAHQMFTHAGSDGSLPSGRAEAQGYSRPVSENIARGFGTPQAIMDAWLASPGHRGNILDCAAGVMGVGYVAAGGWWTQMFGRSQ